jgi:hypothetical protein
MLLYAVAVWIFVLRIEQGEYAGWALLLNMRQYMKNIQQIWGVPLISPNFSDTVSFPCTAWKRENIGAVTK